MNKRLLILFVCLAIVVVTVIVCAVTFTVRSIEILPPVNQDDNFDKAKIVIDSKIKMGSSIFALSEKIIINNIEVANPYVKVVTVERVFPSKVRVKVALRSAIIAIPLDDGINCALVDRELKILSVTPLNEIDSSTVSIVTGYNLVDITTEDCGKMLKLQGVQENLAKTILAMENVGIINEFIPVFAKSINFDNESFVVINTRKGLKIAIRTNSNLTIESQFHSLFSVFESSPYREDPNKYIYVTDNGIITSNLLPL